MGVNQPYVAIDYLEYHLDRNSIFWYPIYQATRGDSYQWLYFRRSMHVDECLHNRIQVPSVKYWFFTYLTIPSDRNVSHADVDTGELWNDHL